MVCTDRLPTSAEAIVDRSGARTYRRCLRVAAFATILMAAAPAWSDGFPRGRSAFLHGDYLRAAAALAPAAQAGNPRAQALLGFMYENGFGVPQSYDAAVDLYWRSAERGDPKGQYLLGLMYDKGHGVVRDEVLSYKWLNLAAAGASGRDRENYLKLRNAVASKMTANQIEAGQTLALAWRAH